LTTSVPDEKPDAEKEQPKPDSADLNDLFDRLAKIFDDPTERSPKPWPWWF
jgi:hypothetical protein